MGDITLRRALDDYKTIYMPCRNFAERIRAEHQTDIEGLIEILETQGINLTKRLNLLIIEKYVAHLEQEGFASLTRKRKVVAMRSFLSFCIRMIILSQFLQKVSFLTLLKIMLLTF